MRKYTIKELLPHINPCELSYQEWINVGFIMKDNGLSAEDYEQWSCDDPRHKKNECYKKWESFHGKEDGVTVGTLVEYAMSQGWEGDDYDIYKNGHCLDWDDPICADPSYLDSFVDLNWLEEKEIKEPDTDNWDQRGEIIKYLETLFDSDDLVCYVTETWSRDGKQLPTKGCFDRTAGELIASLNKHKDITDTIGTVNEKAGAWIRFNPVDGKDVTNSNVTDYRYALVESDTLGLEKQYALIEQLNLPVKIMVNSGGKSLHAIVHIDASSMEEYRSRVDYLYGVCKKNGLEIDQANRNPSRLSRLPGVYRDGKKQFIVSGAMGASSFAEWKEWVETMNDNLPDLDNMGDAWNNLPDLAPCLIQDILRQGHKMLLAGPSKAGKSFALIELVIAIAEGKKWLGNQCAQGRVLYVNLELDRASCLHRFHDVYEAMGIKPDNVHNIDIWNLRGFSIPLDKLAPKLIHRAQKKEYIAVIIDPIYKVITGDENSADQMAQFCNQFDTICTELGTSVIYCHHHSKGNQGEKKAMDRASGSGVFARDPDALLDMLEIELPDIAVTELMDKVAMKAIRETLTKHVPYWEVHIPAEERESRLRFETAAGTVLADINEEWYNEMVDNVYTAQKKAENMTGWTLDYTLREFPKPKTNNVWFDYPLHYEDNTGLLAQYEDTDGETAQERLSRRGNTTRRIQSTRQREETSVDFSNAVENANAGDPPTMKDLVEYTGRPKNTISRWVKQFGYKFVKVNRGSKTISVVVKNDENSAESKIPDFTN